MNNMLNQLLEETLSARDIILKEIDGNVWVPVENSVLNPVLRAIHETVDSISKQVNE